jgi:hypothetical protein
MAIRIQNAFLKCYYDPAFKICRKRLLREFNEMNNEVNKSYYKEMIE